MAVINTTKRNGGTSRARENHKEKGWHDQEHALEGSRVDTLLQFTVMFDVAIQLVRMGNH